MKLCLAKRSIEEKWLVLKKLLLDVVDSCAPVKKLRLKKDQSLPWIDKECLFYLHKRNTMHRKALASKSGRESAEWQAFRSARNFCKALLRRKMVEFFADKDGSYFKSTKSFWAFYKRVVKTKKDSSAAIQSIRSPTGASINEGSAIAGAFNSHLGRLGNNLAFDDQRSVDYVNNRFREMKRAGHLRVSKSFSISAVDLSSSAGVTNIPVKFLIHCADELDPIICNYRGISVLLKCFERALESRLVNYLSVNELLRLEVIISSNYRMKSKIKSNLFVKSVRLTELPNKFYVIFDFIL